MALRVLKVIFLMAVVGSASAWVIAVADSQADGEPETQVVP